MLVSVKDKVNKNIVFFQCEFAEVVFDEEGENEVKLLRYKKNSEDTFFSEYDLKGKTVAINHRKCFLTGKK